MSADRLRACGSCGHPWNVHGGVMGDSGVYECLAEVSPHCPCTGFTEPRPPADDTRSTAQHVTDADDG